MMPIAALMLEKKGGDDDDHEIDDIPLHEEDDFDSLSEKEIVEHKMSAMEKLIEAIMDRKPAQALKALEAFHGLDHAAWDAAEGSGYGDEPEEK